MFMASGTNVPSKQQLLSVTSQLPFMNGTQFAADVGSQLATERSSPMQPAVRYR